MEVSVIDNGWCDRDGVDFGVDGGGWFLGCWGKVLRSLVIVSQGGGG